jgi:hypothetical protein
MGYIGARELLELSKHIKDIKKTLKIKKKNYNIYI